MVCRSSTILYHFEIVTVISLLLSSLDLALFNLSARLEPEVVDFECAECGGDCSACGWSAGNATQLLRDDDGARVARLTNRSGQLGTLWLREPQEVKRGFYARSNPSPDPKPKPKPNPDADPDPDRNPTPRCKRWRSRLRRTNRRL